MLTLEQIEAELMKKFKMNGLMLSDQNVIRLMDQSLESGNSQIISAGIKNDGSLTKNSKVASMDEFENLRLYVRKLYEKTGNAIIDGEVEITPYKMKDKKNCAYCPYRSVCQFDESMENNHYRVLPSQSNEQVLELIGKEVRENE
jgi:ATP-dependent helicase/nuclease subunit B